MPPSSPMAPFHPFSRLPPELRHQIWDLSMAARTIAVPAVPGAASSPAAMRVCREARARYARAYTASTFLDAARPVWVHWGLDTVAAAHYSVQGLPVATLRAVRRLRITVDMDEWEVFYFVTSAYLRAACMPALEEATVVVRTGLDRANERAWNEDMRAWPQMNRRVRFYTEFAEPAAEE